MRVAHCDVHYKDDYLGQCITKLRAWEFSDADEIGFLDSDLVFVREWTPDTLRGPSSGNLWMEIRPWNAAPDARAAWFDITTKLLGQEPPWETMARHPFQYPTQFIRRVWGSVINQRIHAGPHISEFNLLGNYAFLHELERFHWTFPADGPPDLVKQFWSHGGVNFEVEDELRRLGFWEDEK